MEKIGVMKKNDFIPYMNDTEIVHLMRYIDKEKNVLEIGGGHSTVFLSKLVKRITTIEHNVEWGSKLYTILKELELPADIRIIPPNFPQNHPFEPAKDGQFDNYIEYIKKFDDLYDIVIVDGRDRVRCVEASIKNLKNDGILIVHDFWNRTKYHSILNNPQLELIREDNSYPSKEIRDTIVVFRKKDL
jgi:predicted O-methyltransferase YrrM